MGASPQTPIEGKGRMQRADAPAMIYLFCVRPLPQMGVWWVSPPILRPLTNPSLQWVHPPSASALLFNGCIRPLRPPFPSMGGVGVQPPGARPL
jgi:hypothetical protein